MVNGTIYLSAGKLQQYELYLGWNILAPSHKSTSSARWAAGWAGSDPSTNCNRQTKINTFCRIMPVGESKIEISRFRNDPRTYLFSLWYTLTHSVTNVNYFISFVQNNRANLN